MRFLAKWIVPVVVLFLPCYQTLESRFFNPLARWGGKNQADDSVIMAHVLFRHGNRTGQTSELYPKDPYLDFDYFPFGNGQLTNEGKKKEYSIGEALRTRYSKQLGDYFYPDIVDAISTDYNRTKASLQLVLASLFKPKGVEVWNFFLNWQPVPYSYKPTNKDKVLYGINCPNAIKLYNELTASDKLQTEFKQYEETFNYIAENTGLNVSTFLDVYNLYFGISTEEEWGLELPEWTKKAWPKTITDLAIKEYYVQSGSTELIQMAAGYHLQKIINDTKTKIANINEKNGRKLYLYSAHENNIAQMLILLGVFDGLHIPTYGTYLILEVHNIDGVYGIKVYYQNYETKNPRLLKLPECDEFCPLDKFVSLTEEFIPTDDLCGDS